MSAKMSLDGVDLCTAPSAADKHASMIGLGRKEHQLSSCDDCNTTSSLTSLFIHRGLVVAGGDEGGDTLGESSTSLAVVVTRLVLLLNIRQCELLANDASYHFVEKGATSFILSSFGAEVLEEQLADGLFLDHVVVTE
jgi:hypothetical protein